MISRRPSQTFLFWITLLSPLLLFVFLEGILRLAGYGPDLSLFTTEEIGGRTYHVMNPDVKNRYFSRVEFSPNTSPDYFLVPKPPGAFRIFCLGGSTTVGYPYGYVGSFSTFLRNRLKRLFPERRIEVINLGLTATNSFTAADIARELPDYEPDCIIVYDGHNEFYGALGIASHESAGAARWLTTAYLRLIHLRSFLLLRSAIRSFTNAVAAPPVPDQGGTMMERLARGQYIPYKSGTYRACLANFRANLGDLEATCRDRGIPIILSTQVSNLRDRAPFVSGGTREAGSPGRRSVDSLLHLASGQSSAGALAAAVGTLAEATRLDSLRADARYAIARVLDTLGRKSDALDEYRKARDYDELRFRASSDFNDAIRGEAAGGGAWLSDIEGVFEGDSPDSLVGSNLILEHLHPTMRGQFLMAREYARCMRLHGLIAGTIEWAARDTVSDDSLWVSKPSTPIDEFCAGRRISALTSSWPFDAPAQSASRTPLPAPIEKIAEKMLRGTSTWEEGHVEAASAYEKAGLTHEAEMEYRALIDQYPVNVSAYLLLGQLYVRRHEQEKAYAILQESRSVEKTRYAALAVGSLEVNESRADSAIAALTEAVNLSTTPRERSESGYVLALAYARSGSKTRAIERLRLILNETPGYAPAQSLLSRIARSDSLK